MPLRVNVEWNSLFIEFEGLKINKIERFFYVYDDDEL